VLTLTRKVDYALVAMAHLARGDASKASAREISESNGVPLPMLTNILHELLHCGLITSSLGSKGGYQLAKHPEEISISDLINAVEGPFRLTACCADETESNWSDAPCDLAADCRIKGSVRMVHERMLDFLDRITLAHITNGHLPTQLSVSCGAPRGR